MKTILCCVLCVALIFHVPVISGPENFTESDSEVVVEEVYENYVIYDESGNYLTEKRGVLLGDAIIDKNFDKYEVIYIDDENLTAKAKFVESLEKPKVHKKDISEIAMQTKKKKIGLYSTHNDESYIVGDGTESVYGAGGIHDIGNLMVKNLQERNIVATYDETLHIPHNSSAYSRSRKTAQSLLTQQVTAIFDIHRDGASRDFYLANYKGKNYSKVRIVVGQSNPNKEANLQFALWLVSVAESLHPWLIADIYYGNGKYNQDLSSKALLFEMGCHKIEKLYVERTVPVLCEVIDATLFATTVEEETGNLTIGGAKVEGENISVDEALEKQNVKNNKVWPFWVGCAIITGVLAVGIFAKQRKKNHANNHEKC